MRGIIDPRMALAARGEYRGADPAYSRERQYRRNRSGDIRKKTRRRTGLLERATTRFAPRNGCGGKAKTYGGLRATLAGQLGLAEREGFKMPVRSSAQCQQHLLPTLIADPATVTR